MKKTNQKGFTLIELLVVIAIIGLLSTMAVVSLNAARAKSRDAKRVADVKQMQTGLEMYYNSCNSYPLQAVLGALPVGASNGCSGTDKLSTFMSQVPVAPQPYDGSNCSTLGANTYYYQSFNSDGSAACAASPCPSYAIRYCLGAATGNLSANTVLYATPAGMQ